MQEGPLIGVDVLLIGVGGLPTGDVGFIGGDQLTAVGHPTDAVELTAVELTAVDQCIVVVDTV